MKDTPIPPQCTEVQASLRARWVDRLLEAPAQDAPLPEHVAGCSACRTEVDEILRTDDCLQKAFSALDRAIELPSQERVTEIVHKAEQESEAQMIRRWRRPLRIILWGVFYAFTLVAFYALAVTVYRVLQGK